MANTQLVLTEHQCDSNRSKSLWRSEPTFTFLKQGEVEEEKSETFPAGEEEQCAGDHLSGIQGNNFKIVTIQTMMMKQRNGKLY